jgi:hypothetical protein
MGMGMPSITPQPLYITNTDEAERQAFQLAMGKVSQTHTNLGKVTLKIIEAIGKTPHGTAHTEMIEKLKVFKISIDELTQKYEKIVQHKRIPDLAEATTSSNLKKAVCYDYECA